MELASEDALRLNVLVQNAQAVRIDENRMVVYGLNGERELKAPLNPTCRADRYLALVRELLAAAVLDSPGGYPVFLRRWTRMGQIDHDQIDRLLKLGEPEALMAVVCSPGLTDELARRAWWVAPASEYARRMLANPTVAAGAMGKVLAAHLLEHLPFDSEPRDMLDSVRLVLQPGLIDEERRRRLWEAGRARQTYRVGFLMACADALPEPLPPHREFEHWRPALAPPAVQGNPYAALLLKLFDAPGQSFIGAAADALRRPADQEVVAALLNAVGAYFRPARGDLERLRSIEAVSAAAAAMLAAPDPDLAALLAAVPDLAAAVEAMLVLAHVDEQVVTPIFAASDAVGSVMRKRIAPVVDPLLRHLAVLRA